MSLQQRWQKTFGDHPYRFDILLAISILVLNLSFLTFPATESGRPIDFWAILLISIPNIAIVFRRKYPVLMLAIVAIPGFAYWVVGYPNAGSFATTMVLIYAVPLYAKSRRRASYTQIAFFLLLFLVLVSGYFYAEEEDVTIGVIIVNLVAFQLVWLAGETAARRRDAIAELEKQVLVEQDRQQELADQAVISEQNRIARELHDVVAHSMSVVIVQAEGARRMVGRNNEMVDTALEAIESTGRQTLTDIRGIVGLLRNNDEHQPAPSLEMLEELIQASNDAGVPTELTISGDKRDLPMMIELSAFRIIQESLTNARKHAGPSASATVELGYQPHAISINVSDSGRGAAATKPTTGGFGLIGIRERVEAFGGEFEHGPKPGGGYAVRAVLPVEAS